MNLGTKLCHSSLYCIVQVHLSFSSRSVYRPGCRTHGTVIYTSLCLFIRQFYLPSNHRLSRTFLSDDEHNVPLREDREDDTTTAIRKLGYSVILIHSASVISCASVFLIVQGEACSQDEIRLQSELVFSQTF
ncbi:hypothetical protein NEOLEDRAFT_728493 [Neolentinus lepideus HHB14362 ss-1]|uniref:Uncharacterized protein n=1 Tax=Neolentinus lepideus HHB14362 ss-1 TaxID=1314782 RepID=A0A165Q0R1_9AGAM|nr:hypothetical protein NEOLEDRAFT_728493 [Neolentinus lepideus HHB14362 ss-1]